MDLEYCCNTAARYCCSLLLTSCCLLLATTCDRAPSYLQEAAELLFRQEQRRGAPMLARVRGALPLHLHAEQLLRTQLVRVGARVRVIGLGSGLESGLGLGLGLRLRLGFVLELGLGSGLGSGAPRVSPAASRAAAAPPTACRARRHPAAPPGVHTVAAWFTYGCSLVHIRLQPGNAG